MIVSHFRCDWTHPPSDDPVAIFYEVDGRGGVPRLIDVFADGRRIFHVGDAVNDREQIERNRGRTPAMRRLVPTLAPPPA